MIENNYDSICKRKQAKIIKNNELADEKRIKYVYQVRDFIKILHPKNSRMYSTKLSPLNKGLY